jgi:peptide/nickel transport system permease protein
MTETKISKNSFFRQYIRSRQGVIGAVMMLFMILVALLAPWVAPYDPYETISATSSDVLAPPSQGHLLGQDEVGRDVLSSVIYGSRISLLVGFSASLITVVLGCTIGLISGYVGGRLDILLMRITDGVLVIPTLPLMLVIIAVSGRGLMNIILVVGLLSWPYTARVVRAQVLSVKERQFVMRANAIGVSHFGIVMVHILPQVLPIIFASATLDISYAIISEASLSFLGLGDPSLVSWGSMLNRAFMRGAVSSGAWWYLVPPGFLLAWVTLGLNLVSNTIQEIVNPRLRTHHLFDERKILSLLGRLKNHPPNLGGEK